MKDIKDKEFYFFCCIGCFVFGMPLISLVFFILYLKEEMSS